MHRPILLFAAVAAAIFGFWAWLGAPIAMPPSPFATGEKLYCISYAPFRGPQSPLEGGTHIAAEQIDADLARLKQTTDCVRTYSVEHGVDQVPALAAKHGIKVIQGIWLSSNRAKNAWQIETAIALAKRHPDTIAAIVVGNEVLLRGELAVPDVLAALRQVKAAVSQPVTYADVWEFWLRYRDLVGGVDFVTIHILPYWEDFPVATAEAAAHVDAIRARVAAGFAGKEVLIGEMGWPSAGRMREAARPSPADQARVLHEVLARAKAGNYRVNVIEAFDQPWKRRLEGTVGGYWGLYDDAAREAKFTWGVALSNHPRWMLRAVAGIALAGIAILAAWLAAVGALNAAVWVAVGAVALIGGALFGLTVEKGLVESFGWGGLFKSLALCAVAVATPVLAAAALARGVALPRFATLLGGAEARPRDPIALALGIAVLAVCVLALQSALGLVFDPRYKDFPYPSMGASVFALAIVAFVGPRAASPETGHAERIATCVLVLSAVYIAFNEGFANWQAQCVVAALALLALTLWRLAGGRTPAR